VIKASIKRPDRAEALTGIDPSKHPAWKGERAGYRAIHYRIVKLYGKAIKCENVKCKHKDYHRFEWACLDGDYKLERNTWAMLCVFCHRQMDKQQIMPVVA